MKSPAKNSDINVTETSKEVLKSTKIFHTAYGRRRRVMLHTPEPTQTKQSFIEECDINNILKRFETTGELPDLIKENPAYGDFSDVLDFQDAQNLVIMAQMQFDALGARVRERFGNDPAKFLEFAGDPKNATEMVNLGLATIHQKEPTFDPENVVKKEAQKSQKNSENLAKKAKNNSDSED